MAEPDNTGFDESQFNISMSLLERVNKLMYEYNGMMFNGHLEKAFDVLCLMHDELEFSYKKDEREFVNEQEKEAEKFLDTLTGLIDETFNIEGRSFFKRVKERKQFRKQLRVFNRVLRRLMNEKGMLMKQMDEDGL